jgi:hypothetical protein
MIHFEVLRLVQGARLMIQRMFQRGRREWKRQQAAGAMLIRCFNVLSGDSDCGRRGS